MLKLQQTHESKPLSTGSIATLSIPKGGKIHSLALRFSTGAGADVTEAQIRAEIANVRLTFNGKDVVNVSAAKILDTYKSLGQNANDVSTLIAGVMELNIGKLVYTDPAVRDLFGFGTADVTSIQVSITAGTLSAIASVAAYTEREMVEENLGMYCKLLNYNVSFNGTGKHTMDTLPRDPDTSYLMVLADMGASGTITSGEVRINNVTFKEDIPRSVNGLSCSNNRVSQITGYYLYNFTDGNLATRLPMVGVNDARFIQNFSVAAGAAGYNLTALSVVNIPSAVV